MTGFILRCLIAAASLFGYLPQAIGDGELP